MESSSFLTILVQFIRKNILISCLMAGGMIFLGIGLIQYFSGTKDEITFQKGTEIEVATSPSQLKKIVVDVSGEVIKPGVYKLPADARVEDALKAAGGLSQEADQEFVAKSVNLASVLRDGLKIYIPKVGELPVPATVMGVSSDSINSISTGFVSINSASQSELEALPGIGPVTAGKIISSRPYSSVGELLSRKVVGKSIYEKIKDFVGL